MKQIMPKNIKIKLLKTRKYLGSSQRQHYTQNNSNSNESRYFIRYQRDQNTDRNNSFKYSMKKGLQTEFVFNKNIP